MSNFTMVGPQIRYTEAKFGDGKWWIQHRITRSEKDICELEGEERAEAIMHYLGTEPENPYWWCKTEIIALPAGLLEADPLLADTLAGRVTCDGLCYQDFQEYYDCGTVKNLVQAAIGDYQRKRNAVFALTKTTAWSKFVPGGAK